MSKKFDREKIRLLNKDTGNFEDHISESRRAKSSTLDPNMICCEIYNPGREMITFTNILDPSAPQIFCAPDGFCFLPHQYFSGTVPSGNQEIRVIKNYGKSMGKGNKRPSRPEAKLS